MGQKIASLYAEIGADTSGLDKGLSESKSKLGSFKEGFSGFANVAAKSVGFVTAEVALLKKIMDFGAEGAEIEYTREKFDRLAASIGTTGDALMDDLKPAMGGIMSEAELTSAATDLLTLGLAKSHDEAVRLTSVAGQLGMNMNQLVLTLTNQTTMRFDALGIAVDGFDEKVAALEATGMSAEEAFNEAFLQQAEEQIETVGSVADSSSADFMRMEAAIKDAGDALKMELLPTLSAAAVALTDLITGPQKVMDALTEHNKEVAESSSSYREYSTEAERAANAAGFIVDSQGRLRNSQRKVIDENYLLTESQFLVTQEVNKQTAALEAQAEQLKALDGQTANTYVYSHTIQVAGAGQTNAVSGISGSGVYVSGRRAAGGPVFSGQSYLVGEQGPEVVTMGGNGNVTPNNQLMGGDVSAKISEMSAQLDKLNRTLPTAMRDAVLLMGASSGR